jgi:hypothetical protein
MEVTWLRRSLNHKMRDWKEAAVGGRLWVLWPDGVHGKLFKGLVLMGQMWRMSEGGRPRPAVRF